MPGVQHFDPDGFWTSTTYTNQTSAYQIGRQNGKGLDPVLKTETGLILLVRDP